MGDGNDKNDFYWKLLQTQIQEQRIEKVFKVFREAGFEPILIKGWSAARYYPEPNSRLSADTDIAVKPADFLECEALLRQQSIGGVDLHCGLRHLDTVSWNDLFANSKLIKLNKTEVRVLCPEDHLRILCVHWLTDGGVSKDRLRDVLYLIQTHSKDFDWGKCLDKVSEIRRHWIICTVGLAVKYLGLETKNEEINNVAKNLPAWLSQTVENEWNSGVSLKPLQNCLNSRGEFFEQLRKRIPPNPIQATIDMEGRFDEGSRIFYQLGSFLLRVKPSLKRIFITFWRERKAKLSKRM